MELLFSRDLAQVLAVGGLILVNLLALRAVHHSAAAGIAVMGS